MLRLTAIQEVNDDAAVSSSRYRPPKVTTYPAIKSNPLGKSATRIKNPNESLDGSIFSPNKDISADFVMLTSPKKSPYSSTGKDSGSRLSSNHQRNSNSQSSLNLYSPSYKSPMRSTSNSKFALNKTEILDSRETRQRQSYGDDHSLGIYVTQQMEASREDWGSINGIETKDQQSEDVKKLGAWQFEKMREKGPSQEADNIMPSKYKSPSKSREDFTLPTINAKLVNMIMTSPDEERYKYQDTKKGLVSPNPSEGEFKKLNEFGESSVQSLQNAIRETNQGILLDMISRKIKDFFVKIDINTMNAEQLKLYTRAIAESVLDQFKALKGATNITKIQNRVEAVIGKLKNSKNPQDEMVRDMDVPTKRPKPVIDYKYQELNLLKSFQDSVLNIKNINDRLVFLNKQTLKLNTQIRYSIKQLEVAKEKHVTSTISTLEDLSPEEEKKKKRIDLQKVLRLFHEKADENGPSDSDRRAQRPNLDKKKKRIEAENKIKEIQEQLMTINEEVHATEKELNTEKQFKTSYKIQLKNLYLKLLKDEISLIDSNNIANYTAAVRALYKMDGEVKAMIFPDFVDQTSIKYMINCAKIQDQLEVHCQKNNMEFLITDLEEFKDILNQYNFNSKGDSIHDQNSSTSMGRPGTLSKDFIPTYEEMGEKDFNTLLDKFKGKMTDLKKVNLKAKKLTQVTFYNAKGKNTVTRWEEVDPQKASMSTLLLSQSQLHTEKDGSLGNFDRSFKLDVDAVKMTKTPLEEALEMLDKLKKMKEEEMERIIKLGLTKEDEEKQKLSMKKIFRFVLGKKAGEKGYFQWHKEKSKYNKKVKQQGMHHPKPSDLESLSPKRKVTPKETPFQNEIWMSPKADNLLEYGFMSPSKLNISSGKSEIF